MKIYVDGVPVYTISNVCKIDTYVKAGKGSHMLVVQAWDTSGAVFKSTVNVKVK